MLAARPLTDDEVTLCRTSAQVAEHPDRLHLRFRSDARDAEAIVRARDDGPGDVGAMPAGVTGRGPVGGVGVATVSIVGRRQIADHAVAGYRLPDQIGMARDADADADADVEDGDNDAEPRALPQAPAVPPEWMPAELVSGHW
jgi:hypothetical protein